MDKDKALIIIISLFIVWCIFGYFTFIYPGKLKKKTTQVNAKQTPQQMPKMTIQLYNDLFVIFKEAIKYIATIQEIDILIRSKAEIPATFLDSKSDYVSYDNLLIWRNSYVRQLRTYYAFLIDTYQSVKVMLPEHSNELFMEQIGYIGSFIDKYCTIKEKTDS